MFFRIIFSLLIPLSLLANSQPDWVKQLDVPVHNLSVKQSEANLQYLLIDTQRNWDEKTLYRHFAIKLLSQSGIEKISQLNINFDPSFSEVEMHMIRVYREGECSDRLMNSRHHTIQRERELEKNLYNGELTIVYFLDDLREGDILEYSYSVIGVNPLFASHCTDMIYLQKEYSVERIHHRFICDPCLSFLIKPINTDIEPNVADLSSSFREWTWEVLDAPPYRYDPDEPTWHNPPAHIELSQYQSWKEVSQKIYPLFALCSDFSTSVPAEMQNLVSKWINSASGLKERALLALRFVQDEVRYLGMEDGIGAYKPNGPISTFQRRFGDCKDKVLLLHALLDLMDIRSKPILVHTALGKKLPNVLPMPNLFNHAVLQIEIGGSLYWVDPTSNLQGGSLETNAFQNYEHGLLISNDTDDLISCPKSTLKNPTEIDVFFKVNSEDAVEMKITSIFHESRADRVRRIFEANGLKKMSEQNLSHLQETYGSVTTNEPLKILDDREKNLFTIVESYCVPTKALSDRKSLEIFSRILYYYVETCVNPERISPYILAFPLWVKEHIHLENPFVQWSSFSEDYSQNHDSFLYKLSSNIEGTSAYFDLEFRHLKDHIHQDFVKDYWKKVNEISQKGMPRMTIAHSSAKPSSNHSSSAFIMPLFIWPLILALTHKKRSTQDVLSFHFTQFRHYFLMIPIFTAIFLTGGKFLYALLAPCVTGIILQGIFYYVFTRRSNIGVLLMQLYLAVQLYAFSILIIRGTSFQDFDKIYCFCFYWLYSASCFIALNKARNFLLLEQNDESSRAISNNS